jgi:hypothetical protein
MNTQPFPPMLATLGKPPTPYAHFAIEGKSTVSGPRNCRPRRRDAAEP